LPFQSLTALALIVIIAYRTQEPPKCLLQSEKAKKKKKEKRKKEKLVKTLVSTLTLN